MINIAAIVKGAFAIAGNQFGATEPVIYLRTGQEDYDTTTGTAEVPITEIESTAIFGNFAQKELGGPVKMGDKKVLIQASDLNLQPSVSDRIRDQAGIEWEIIALMSTQPSVLHIFQCRGVA